MMNNHNDNHDDDDGINNDHSRAPAAAASSSSSSSSSHRPMIQPNRAGQITEKILMINNDKLRMNRQSTIVMYDKHPVLLISLLVLSLTSFLSFVQVVAAAASSSSSSSSSSSVAGGSSRPTLSLENVPFHVVCKLMRAIYSAIRSRKEKLLCKFWGAINVSGVSLFPLMRLLLPQLDADRGGYGLREAQLGESYMAALGLSKNLDQAVRLKRWKLPQANGAVSGDFALVLEDVLKKYISVKDAESKMTIGGVNAMLDSLAGTGGAGAKVDRQVVFRKLVADCSPNENMWICRIICKDLNIGMREESMLKLFDASALDIYNACSSLRSVCEFVAMPLSVRRAKALAAGGAGDAAGGMASADYFRACKPMLASSPPYTTIIERMKGARFYVEDKYDGERIIIHKKGSEVKMFTRNSIDYTARYGYGAAFIPIIMQALPNHDCIIDGELMSIDPITGIHSRFGSNRTVALAAANREAAASASGLSSQEFAAATAAASSSSSSSAAPTQEELMARAQLYFIAFDVLKIDDELVINKPLTERRVLLHSLVNPIKHRFEVIKHRSDLHTTEALLAALIVACEGGGEGLVIKNSTSTYKLKDRSDNWVKMKHDHITGMRDNMDLLLLGAYYGEGARRTGGVSHFMLGILPKKLTDDQLSRQSDRQAMPVPMMTFCKVGSGYSVEKLKKLREELEPKFRPYNQARPPAHLMGWHPERDTIPDVWIDPRDSIIVEVKCYEITPCKSNNYVADYTCRFPRVVDFRRDKDWHECMTYDEMLVMAQPNYRSSANNDDVNMRDAGDDYRDRDADDNDDQHRAPAPDWRDDAGKDDARDDGDNNDDAGTTANRSNMNRDEESTHMGESNAGGGGGGGGSNRFRGRSGGGGGGGRWHSRFHAGRAHDSSSAVTAPSPAKKGGKRKRKDDSLAIKKGSVISLFCPTDISAIGALKSHLLENKSFCVMSTDASPDKADLERLIASHGGTFTQNPMLGQTACIFARHNDNSLKLSIQRAAAKFDVVHYSWLVHSTTRGELMPMDRTYIISGTAATEENLRREIDDYGDVYAVHADDASMKAAIIVAAQSRPHPYLASAEKEKAESAPPIVAVANPPPSSSRAKAAAAAHVATINHSTDKLKHRANSITFGSFIQNLVQQSTLPQNAMPSNYSSMFNKFTPHEQKIIKQSSTKMACMGVQVWVYGKDNHSTAVQLALLTIRLFGGIVRTYLNSDITHILMCNDDNDDDDIDMYDDNAASKAEPSVFTRDALDAIISEHNITLVEEEYKHQQDDDDMMIGEKKKCLLITTSWVEMMRQKIQAAKSDA